MQVDYIHPTWVPSKRQFFLTAASLQMAQLTKTETSIKEVNMSKQKTTRDTSFSKSWQLIDKYGLDTIREL